jgi:hypothetical protein
LKLRILGAHNLEHRSAMRLKDKIVSVLERAMLNAAISVLVLLAERRLKRAFSEREAKLGTKKRAV